MTRLAGIFNKKNIMKKKNYKLITKKLPENEKNY